MVRQNLHTHTTFDDGKNTPEEMVQAALAAGLTSLGFSGHCALPYESVWTMTEETTPLFRAEIARLKACYRGKIEIFCGLEYDVVSETSLDGYDYVIGSAHHLPLVTDYISVDESPEITDRYLKDWYGGDAIWAAEAFYAQYEQVAQNPRLDIVGHLDLLTKFNEKHPVFDTQHPRYRDAAVAAMERLVAADKIFEINTGAISRGWRTTPYPSAQLLRQLGRLGGRILISSDAHAASGISCYFKEAAALARECGFREAFMLSDGAFVPYSL